MAEAGDLMATDDGDLLHERVRVALRRAAELQAHIGAEARNHASSERARSLALRAEAADRRLERPHYRNMIDELRELTENLHRAHESRAGIEQAKGIIMATQGCSPDEAFDVLRTISQRTNRKLAAVAEEVVERALRPRSTGAQASSTG